MKLLTAHTALIAPEQIGALVVSLLVHVGLLVEVIGWEREPLIAVTGDALTFQFSAPSLTEYAIPATVTAAQLTKQQRQSMPLERVSLGQQEVLTKEKRSLSFPDPVQSPLIGSSSNEVAEINRKSRGVLVNGLLLPKYPERARRWGQEGQVVYEVQVGVDGHVRSITLQSSSGYHLLDEAAAAALRAAQFEPALTLGQPVEATKSLTFLFQLKDPR